MLSLQTTWTFPVAVHRAFRPFKTVKLSEAYNGRQLLGNKTESLTQSLKLVGNSNETSVTIEGINTTALIDTGSCVSTISQDFYENSLSTIEVQPMENLLKVECADGKLLPYSGFIQARLGIKGMEEVDCLFLIVPGSNYSHTVPILLGTNILSELMDNCKVNFGERFLQRANLDTAWCLAFRTMLVRQRNLRRNKFKLATIRSSEKNPVYIKPNTSVTIKGYLTHRIDHPQTAAIVEQTEGAGIPDDLDITPTIVTYNYGDKHGLEVHISNITLRTVAISPNAVLAELQPVVIDHNQNISLEETEDSKHQDINIESPDLTSEQRQELLQLIQKHQDIFSKGDNDIGHYKGVTHKINLSDETPFKQKFRRIPPSMIDEIRAHLDTLLSAGIIRKSFSPFASNIVIVRKKNGKLRMCVDYRMLNQRTIKDSYALPRIEEVLDTLAGAKYFTVLDMKSGYHQVEIEESHKHKTAFTVGPLGFYEFSRLPFGLCNSPATYQRLMEECLGDLNMKICVIYLDDLIIFGNTFEEHMEHLEIIFNRLRECNLKLTAEKCKFGSRKVKYVGFIVSEEGIETDPEKVEKIKNWPTPQNPDEVRQFIGFAGFYRKFIKDFSKIIKPLNELMPKENQRKKRKPQQPDDWLWTADHQTAFDTLKEHMTNAPILGYANYNLPFEVHIDASGDGLGAVLYQQQEDKWRVISYASRALRNSEKHYPTMKLEFLALKWAVTEKFSDYLYGNRFVVKTDNNPLTYVLSTAKLDATGHRWVAALAAYDFEIFYKPGRNNGDADALSRYPKRIEEINSQSVKAICNAAQPQPLVSSIAPEIDIIEISERIGQPLAHIETRELRKEQNQDRVISFWVRAVRDKTLPSRQSFLNNRENMIMYRNFEHFSLIRGVLYREVTEKEQKKKQLVLPQVFVESALKGLHDEMGHPGRERTQKLLKERFFWPGIAKDADDWVKKCDRCFRSKASTNIRAPMVNIRSSYPLEIVCMDFLCLEPSKGGIENVLVITDHFTKFAVTVPTRNQTAKTTAEALYNHFILPYGIPAKIHSDQGGNFESELMKELCNVLGMQKSRTTVYHPMSNGITERFNRTLIGMLGTLEPEKKGDWKNHIAALVQAYNCTPHSSTGVSPYELMFGRKPRLPVDVVFGLNAEASTEPTTASEYVRDLKNRLEQAFKTVKKESEKAQSKQKKYFDDKARATQLKPGDKVLVKVLAFKGRHKLADNFEEEVYEVMEQPNTDIPVFKVKSASGKERVLHRNHLLPVRTQVEEEKEEPARVKPTPAPRRRPMKEVSKNAVEPSFVQDVKVNSESEEEDDTFEIRLKGASGRKRREESEDEEEEEDVAEVEPRVIPRRSGRERRPPERYDAYFINAIHKHEKAETVKKLINTGCLQAMPDYIANRVLDGILLN